MIGGVGDRGIVSASSVSDSSPYPGGRSDNSPELKTRFSRRDTSGRTSACFGLSFFFTDCRRFDDPAVGLSSSTSISSSSVSDPQQSINSVFASLDPNGLLSTLPEFRPADLDTGLPLPLLLSASFPFNRSTRRLYSEAVVGGVAK